VTFFIIVTKEIFFIGLTPANIIMRMWYQMYSQVFVLVVSLILNQIIVICHIRLDPSLSFEGKSIHLCFIADCLLTLLFGAREFHDTFLF